MKRIITCNIIIIILSVLAILAQNQRYKDAIFSTYQVQRNIVYGVGSKNVLDIYTGYGDVAENRPLVIFIHGGGFKDGDKVSNFGTKVCGGLAKRGYVVASINYRLTPIQSTDQQSFEAMIKALQDSKAAVRYFRKNSSQYGIDTSQIFATGSSAGSITALHLAYLNPAEIPSYVVDPTLIDLEGISGNPGYSSKIHGVISNWGAIGDTSWIKKGDVPVYCVHGVDDSTVYFTRIPAKGPFKYSSKYINIAAQRNGITTSLRIFNKTGHTLDNNSSKQDSVIQDFSKWLFQITRF
jgi:dienelactone hydrolase